MLTHSPGPYSDTTNTYKNAVPERVTIVIGVLAILAVKHTVLEPYACTLLWSWIGTSLRQLLD
jgi:hypothetical protein